MLVGFAEGLGAAKTYAAREHYEIDPNRELLGLGAANLGSGLCSGMVVNGSLSKTAVNGSAGARSQMSGIVVAVLTVVTLLFLTGLFEDLPEATLAAVVIAAVIELVDIACPARFLRPVHAAARAHLRAGGAARLHRRRGGDARRVDLRHAAGTGHRHHRVAAVAALPGVQAVRRRARSGRRRRRPVRRSQTVIRRTTPSPAFRCCASSPGCSSPTPTPCARRSRSTPRYPGTRGVVLDAEAIAFVDITAVRMLDELADDLEPGGQQLVIAHDLGQVGDLLSANPETNLQVFPTIDEAIAAVDA